MKRLVFSFLVDLLFFPEERERENQPYTTTDNNKCKKYIAYLPLSHEELRVMQLYIYCAIFLVFCFRLILIYCISTTVYHGEEIDK